jgi:hypothetical protein
VFVLVTTNTSADARPNPTKKAASVSAGIRPAQRALELISYQCSRKAPTRR